MIAALHPLDKALLLHRLVHRPTQDPVPNLLYLPFNKSPFTLWNIAGKAKSNSLRKMEGHVAVRPWSTLNTHCLPKGKGAMQL